MLRPQTKKSKGSEGGSRNLVPHQYSRGQPPQIRKLQGDKFSAMCPVRFVVSYMGYLQRKYSEHICGHNTWQQQPKRLYTCDFCNEFWLNCSKNCKCNFTDGTQVEKKTTKFIIQNQFHYPQTFLPKAMEISMIYVTWLPLVLSIDVNINYFPVWERDNILCGKKVFFWEWQKGKRKQT